VIRGEDGAAYVETLIAFPPTLFLFLAIFQFTEIAAADLVVRRAAHAAVRAAVVVYSDDEHYYNGAPPPARKPYVDEAARRTLLAAPEIDYRRMNVAVSGEFAGNAEITVDLRVPYRCTVFWARLVCGWDSRIQLDSRSSLPFLGSRLSAGG
jgi:Flp pilus assembly protein TadG